MQSRARHVGNTGGYRERGLREAAMLRAVVVIRTSQISVNHMAPAPDMWLLQVWQPGCSAKKQKNPKLLNWLYTGLKCLDLFAVKCMLQDSGAYWQMTRLASSSAHLSPCLFLDFHTTTCCNWMCVCHRLNSASVIPWVKYIQCTTKKKELSIGALLNHEAEH